MNLSSDEIAQTRSGKESNSLFERLIPVAGVACALLALYAPGIPVWVQYGASFIGVALALAWLLSKSGWIGTAIKFRFFRSRLPKDQAVRLSILLDDLSQIISYNHTFSPFCLWHSLSNRYHDKLRMNYAYHGAVHGWIADLMQKFSDPRNNSTLLLPSMSKALLEATRMAEHVEQQLNEAFRIGIFPESDAKQIQKEWDTARSHFNQSIDKWRTLFKEANKSAKIECNDYFHSLQMVG